MCAKYKRFNDPDENEAIAFPYYKLYYTCRI
jgi:hypothetical protein